VRFLDLPKDVQVEDVYSDWVARAFLVRVSHPSFAEVPDGEQTPHFEGNAWAQVYEDRNYEKRT
jgi:hypothetical protein